MQNEIFMRGNGKPAVGTNRPRSFGGQVRLVDRLRLLRTALFSKEIVDLAVRRQAPPRGDLPRVHPSGASRGGGLPATAPCGFAGRNLLQQEALGERDGKRMGEAYPAQVGDPGGDGVVFHRCAAGGTARTAGKEVTPGAGKSRTSATSMPFSLFHYMM